MKKLNIIKFFLSDLIAELKFCSEFKIDFDTDVLVVQNSIEYIGNGSYNLSELSITIPLERKINELLAFKGRWINEFSSERISWKTGSYLRENRKGRTSHDNIPYIIAGEEKFTNESGCVYGFHLAWSGNSRINASIITDGSRMVQMSELLFPGEIVLKSGESYKTPKLYSAFSRTGLNGMSQCFHKFLRNSREHIIFKRKERPVQFNTWEAVYFEHDISTLFKLVDSAYDLGIERFVLDDGWFKGRDSEKAGLGDWYIDKLKYPEGLKPLIEYINSKNMEFGLWFEPEMVNPDSDLFRLHPDWILGVDGYDQPKGRYQYVLDLSRKEVFEYILNRLDSLLTEYNIGYVKWDMNRDLSQPGNRFNIPSVHEQVKSYYKLLEFITRSHPDVEFESCASGGGRADFEVLRYTNRIWTSDCNDPFERHFIQKGLIFFQAQKTLLNIY